MRGCHRPITLLMVRAVGARIATPPSGESRSVLPFDSGEIGVGASAPVSEEFPERPDESRPEAVASVSAPRPTGPSAGPDPVRMGGRAVIRPPRRWRVEGRQGPDVADPLGSTPPSRSPPGPPGRRGGRRGHRRAGTSTGTHPRTGSRVRSPPRAEGHDCRAAEVAGRRDVRAGKPTPDWLIGHSGKPGSACSSMTRPSPRRPLSRGEGRAEPRGGP